MRERAFRILGAAALLAAACTQGPTAVSPSPSASPTPTAAARPTFELASFQYAVQTKGKLRVGTAEDAAPFARRDGARSVGFDADVAREIAKAIFGPPATADPDAFIQWVPVVSATRISTLTDDKADLVIATFVITEDRQRQVDFSSVYFRTGQRIMVKAPDPIAGPNDLAEKTACTVRGSPAEKTIAAKAPGVKVLSVDTYDACVGALAQGAADAVTADESVLLPLRRPGMKIVGPYLSDDPYGIGVKKGRTGFVPFLDRLIVDMIADGRWAMLYKQHITPLSGDVKEAPHDRGRPG